MGLLIDKDCQSPCLLAEPLPSKYANRTTASICTTSRSNNEAQNEAGHPEPHKTDSAQPLPSGSGEVKKTHVNKYTGRPFSAHFWQILEKRKNLPVWEYYKQFMDMVRNNQCMVLVGETGSGKITQVRGVHQWAPTDTQTHSCMLAHRHTYMHMFTVPYMLLHRLH